MLQIVMWIKKWLVNIGLKKSGPVDCVAVSESTFYCPRIHRWAIMDSTKLLTDVYNMLITFWKTPHLSFIVTE